MHSGIGLGKENVILAESKIINIMLQLMQDMLICSPFNSSQL